MADQVVLMRDGRIEQDAAAGRALRAARHHLRGALRRHAADERAAGNAAGRRLGTPAGAPAGRRARHAGGRRPRRKRRGSASSGVPATVAAVEYLGADTLIDTRIGDRAVHRAAARPRRRSRAGEQVSIAWDAGAAHWFDLSSSVSYRSTEDKQPSTRGEQTQGGDTMQRREFLEGHSRPRRAAPIAKPAIAQGATEVSFFYPIAVGGPITKIIDGYAADFEKANPSIKVKPIYAGTYQETIIKALTAHKSGNAAGDLRAALDRHVHADRRGRDRPVRRLREDRRRQEVADRASSRPSWKTARPAARPGACRSSARPSCSTGTRSCSRKPASIPRRRRRTGRSSSPSRRSSPSATARATPRNGACRSRPPASPTGCSRA